MKFFVVLIILFSSLLFADDATHSSYESAIKDYKGKIVYLDFWASWCGPCRKSFPWMNKMQTEYGSENFSVVSVNLDSDKELAEKFLVQTPANFPIVYDPNGDIASELKLKGMPSSFLINTRGKIISTHVGFTAEKKERYEQEILKLLGKQQND